MKIQTKRGVSTTITAAIIIVIVIVAFVAYYLFATTPGQTTTTTSAASALPGKGMAIGVNFDVGGLGDRGFNDLAYAGMMQANKTLGVDYYYTISESTGDFISNFQTLMSHHVNLLVGVGFDQDQAIAQLAAQNPKQLFA